MQLNGPFNIEGVHDMMEGEYCLSIDMMFPSISAFLDKATKYSEDGDLTKLNSVFLRCYLKYMGTSDWSKEAQYMD